MKTIYVLSKKKILDAIQKLIDHYEERESIEICPLCKISIFSCIDSPVCPWIWFEGINCEDAPRIFKFKRKEIIVLRINRPKRWTAMRLEQLKRWKRKIKNDL